MGFEDSPLSNLRTVLLGVAMLFWTDCKPAARCVESADGSSVAGTPGGAVANTRDTAPSPFRAWPAPPPGPGVALGSKAGSPAPPGLVAGDAARASVPDRCPDHDECERIANNSADVAHASCDGQCDRCCPHQTVDDCAARECNGACERCADDGCRRVICNPVWLAGCRDRCRAEMDACAGCRGVWCREGPARRGCHSDVDSLHRSTLHACERDCPAGEKRADGSCVVSCATAKKTSCSKSPKDCTQGQSPDCRCECNGAVGGVCVSWNAVCGCD